MSTNGLPPGVTRGPEGRFQSGGDTWDDIEVVTFGAQAGVEASDLGGGTSFEGTASPFEGLELVDYDEIVDRNETLHLLHAEHHLTTFANSTETADGTVAAGVEVSASPSLSAPTLRATSPVAGTSFDDGVVTGFANTDDTIDILGRPMMAMGGAPFSDGATGVGGAGSEGDDTYSSSVWPAEYGRFHPRDELFMNGRLVTWNIDDAGVHAELSGQHIYGVLQD